MPGLLNGCDAVELVTDCPAFLTMAETMGWCSPRGGVDAA